MVSRKIGKAVQTFVQMHKLDDRAVARLMGTNDEIACEVIERDMGEGGRCAEELEDERAEQWDEDAEGSREGWQEDECEQWQDEGGDCEDYTEEAYEEDEEW